MKFTVEKKWRDEWFHSLNRNQKLLFMYFCDVADAAGYIEKNGPLFSYETGIPEEEIDVEIRGLAKGCLGVSQGLAKGCQGLAKGYWLVNHIRHQKNIPLRYNVSAHIAIIRRLIAISNEFPEALNFLNENALPGWQQVANPYPTLTQPLPKGSEIGIGIGIGKREEGTGGKGDEAHQKLREHPELRGLTWEASLIARRSWPDGDYLGTVDQILEQAVLTAPVTKPGAWLETQYAKLASGIPLKRGGMIKKPEALPVEKRKVFMGMKPDDEEAQ